MANICIDRVEIFCRRSQIVAGGSLGMLAVKLVRNLEGSLASFIIRRLQDVDFGVFVQVAVRE